MWGGASPCSRASRGFYKEKTRFLNKPGEARLPPKRAAPQRKASAQPFFHRTIGLRAAVTSSTRDVRVE